MANISVGYSPYPAIIRVMNFERTLDAIFAGFFARFCASEFAGVDASFVIAGGKFGAAVLERDADAILRGLFACVLRR